jgi:hypothetical protein
MRAVVSIPEKSSEGALERRRRRKKSTLVKVALHQGEHRPLGGDGAIGLMKLVFPVCHEEKVSRSRRLC